MFVNKPFPPSSDRINFSHFENISSSITQSADPEECRPLTEMTSFSLILALTFVINLFAAIAIWNLKGFNNNKHHLTVRVLVISDVIIPLPILPLSIASYVNCGWPGGDMICTISAIMSSLFLVWSSYIVFIMCVLRYMVVNMPIRYRQLVSQTRLGVVLAVGFVWVLLHLLLPVLGLGKFKLYEKGQYCGLDLIPQSDEDKTLVYLTVSEATFILTSLLFLTAGIHRSLNRRRKISGQWSLQQKRGAGIQRTYKTHGEFAVLTLVIVVAFELCCLPWLVYRVMVATSYAYVDEDVYYYTELVVYINPLLNPFIYVIFSKNYREAVCQLLVRLSPVRLCQNCPVTKPEYHEDIAVHEIKLHLRRSTLKTANIKIEPKF